MNKKGFTLVELLAVIIILSVVLLVVIPVVDSVVSGSKQTAYNAQIERIKQAASDWSISNAKYLPNEEGESITIYLGDLKANGFIAVDVKNPKTNKILSNNTTIVITNKDGDYDFEVNLVDISSDESPNAPILVIGGNIIDYVEVNQDGISYTIPTATAKKASGESINASYISYQIIKGNSVVSSIDTSTIGSYKIIYSVTDSGLTGTYEKLVEVRDTTKPVVSFSSSITSTVGSSINYTSGVNVTDNSGESITPSVDSSKVGSTVGTYYVYYTATDSSGNTTTIKREVIINN